MEVLFPSCLIFQLATVNGLDGMPIKPDERDFNFDGFSGRNFKVKNLVKHFFVEAVERGKRVRE